MGEQTKRMRDSKSVSRKKTVLLVDDSHVTLHYLVKLIEAEGFKVIIARDAEEALASYAKTKPTLIVTDLIMPGMSGLELVQVIRDKDQTTPIIIFTGWDTMDYAVNAIKLGVNDFLSKGAASTDELLSSIKRLSSMTPAELENIRLNTLISKLAEENKHLREQLEEQKNKITANAVIQQGDTFIRSLVHDMNNEFAQTGGSLRAIRQLAADSAEIQEECDSIERSLNYFGQLLQRMKSRAGIGKPHIEPIDIPEMIKKADSFIRPRIPSNIQFEISADPSTLQGKVLVDTEQVLRVFLELINNAVHALRNSEGVIKLNFTVGDGILKITVSNNGPSIPEEIREKIFKEQVPSSKTEGMGIGLLLAKTILNVLGGDISLEYPESRWTVFTIQLPLYETQKDD